MINMAFSKKYLYLFVIAGFAVAQPIYDLLGRNPEFFVAHGTTPLVIIGLVIFLSAGLPFFLCLLETAARAIGEKVRVGLHLLLMGMLAVLFLLPPVKRFVPWGDAAVLTAALLGGLTFAIMYLRWKTVRIFMTVLIPAIVIFPLWFLTMTPVSRLVLPQSVEALDGVTIKNPLPVILIVLDEMNTTALLDETGRIDSGRFQNFATLADQSVWFPNAVASDLMTPQAIPAILTGRHPKPEAKLVPTSRDYPDNLFTLLGSRLPVNAFEAQTALCPEDICQTVSKNSSLRDMKFFLSDIVYIYLNMVAPSAWANQLPTLDGQWTGFARKNQPHVDPAKGFKNREEQFESFISEIEKSTDTKLHFLHILLPHIPYNYLSTGQMYNQSINHIFPEGIRDESSGWTQNESLIHVAYLQYLQQIGYVDHLLGKLLEKIMEKGLFDQSLIILTADHGVSFRPGRLRRGVTLDNIHDVLKVPLFVKLPGQSQGKIKEDLVAGIDILPTIADILDVKIPWDVDGRSMFSEKKTPRTKIQIASCGHFTAEQLDGFPSLEWQLRHFGAGTSLDRLGSKGPFPELIEKKVAEFYIAQSEKLRFSSEILQQFQYVDLRNEIVPALFTGEILGAGEQDLPLAITLNGGIQATTTTGEWVKMSHYFAALLPESAFKEGPNPIELFMIEEQKNGLSLTKILPVPQEGWSFSVSHKYDDQMVFVKSDGVEISVDPEQVLMHGYVDVMVQRGDNIYLNGWAGDDAYRPAEYILVLAGERLVAEIRPDIAREDVAEHFSRKAMLYSGFEALIPISSIGGTLSDIRLFAVSMDRKAGELKLSEIGQ